MNARLLIVDDEIDLLRGLERILPSELDCRILTADAGEKAAARRLTAGESFTVGSFEWSPDGAHLAAIAGADINDPAAARLMVGSTESEELAELFEGKTHLRVDPDTREVIAEPYAPSA